ncbi:MAG: cytochrome ubiquinol oxidase subunit I [Thermodesulfobacteriota bacterium]
MHYPVWELYFAGGGLLVAVIAVLHVFVAHFAIGGGLYLVLTERKAYKENSRAIFNYTKSHTKFFLLLTLVFGGLSGVGIWFTISVLSPGATSVLIHNFLFAWATEWVFFLVEIIALFFYYYGFDHMTYRDHQRVGWIYFFSAWMSLFFINGIITFMLTPGEWLHTKDFWDGFFNPTFWPSLVFRSALAFSLAGVFGFATSVFSKNRDLNDKLLRYNASWLVFPLLLTAPAGYWYLHSTSAEIKSLILFGSPEIEPFVHIIIWGGIALFLGGLIMASKLPGQIKKPLAIGLLAAALVYTGSFEWIREAARKPYLIHEHLYSTGIYKGNEQALKSRSFLSAAKWTQNDRVDKSNQLQSGKEIFRIQCSGCHSVGGPINDILPLTQKYGVYGMDSQLNGQGKMQKYMPEFLGTKQERRALAYYIVNGLQDKEIAGKEREIYTRNSSIRTPEFNPENDKYVLLAWNELGMKYYSHTLPYIMFAPPGNNINAQLIKRGASPDIVTQGVEIKYSIQEGFRDPASNSRFWEYAPELYGLDIDPGTGPTGFGINGTMQANKTVFRATDIPVIPISGDKDFNPYPVFTLRALDKKSKEPLAVTKTVAPVSTEMRCDNCHGGNWDKNADIAPSKETSLAILRVHDKNNRTDLLSRAKKEKPVLCRDCHPDSRHGSPNATGSRNTLNLSASMHGWHANYLTDRNQSACFNCHPASRQGHTRSFRGTHSKAFSCIDCHGTMEDHAISLLKGAEKNGRNVEKLEEHLHPRMAKSKKDIMPRDPWVQQPDCLGCHTDFKRPSLNATAFNSWTGSAKELYRNRKEISGKIICASCHSSPHAIYPAKNLLFNDSRDTMQPLQYQENNKTIGTNNCSLCHKMEMGFNYHHDNMIKNQ